MDKQHDSTASACEALAAWDKLFNEREALNQSLDCSNDAADHEPEGKLPAETVRDLATAATLLEHVNTLIDKANERQARRPDDTDEANTLREAIADMLLAKARRKGFTVQHRDGESPFQLVGPRVTIEGLAEQVAELCKGSTQSTLATLDRIVDEHADKSPQECAARLRQFNYDVLENIAASMDEDGFTVTKTWTPKGLRHFLAQFRTVRLLPQIGLQAQSGSDGDQLGSGSPLATGGTSSAGLRSKKL